MLLRPADDGGDDDESLGLPLLLLLGGVLDIFWELHNCTTTTTVNQSLRLWPERKRGTAGARSSSYVYGEREALGRQQGKQWRASISTKFKITNQIADGWAGWIVVRRTRCLTRSSLTQATTTNRAKKNENEPSAQISERRFRCSVRPGNRRPSHPPIDQSISTQATSTVWTPAFPSQGLTEQESAP
jgi:hypothetical protein